MYNLTDLQTFVSIVDNNSIHGAAAAQQVSVATVSLRLSKLEKALSTVLVFRDSRKLELSSAGEVFYQRVCAILEALRDAEYQIGKIGVAALMMVAHNNNIEISEDQAKDAIVPPLLSLPAHADVKAGLSQLESAGYKLVTLTNSSNYGVTTQLENAGLTDFFAARMSIEDIQVYKPDLRAYRWALEKLGVKPEEALMVAAHGWDVAGAKAAGMQTAFVARPGKALYPLAQAPDYVVKDLNELVKALSQR